MALAAAIRLQPAPAFEDAPRCSWREDRDEQVQTLAAAAMGALGSPRFLPALLPMLAERDVRRGRARGAASPSGRPRSSSWTSRWATTPAARAAPPPAAHDQPLPGRGGRAACCCATWSSEADGMVRFKILRGLGPRRHGTPGRAARRRASCARPPSARWRRPSACVHWRGRAADGRAEDVAARHARARAAGGAAARQGGAHARARLPAARPAVPRRGLREHLPRPAQPQRQGAGGQPRAAGEPAPARRCARRCWPSSTTADDAARLAGAGPFYRPPPLEYEDLLAAMLDQAGETLRCIAAYHVGELGLQRAAAAPGGADGAGRRRLLRRAGGRARPASAWRTMRGGAAHAR